MTDLTMGIIYTIKQRGSSDSRIQSYLRKYYDNFWEYGREEIDKILRECCADYISTADNPIEEARRYFLNSNVFTSFEISEHHRMINFLQQTQVRKNSEYINGFKEMEDFA